MKFEWDLEKARSNLIKHGIRFEEAITAFDDPFGRVEEDSKHSTPIEKRELRLGLSDIGVLVIVFTIRYPGPIYRLISARRASRKEREFYEQTRRV